MNSVSSKVTNVAHSSIKHVLTIINSIGSLMYFAFVGLIAGILIGVFTPFTIPIEYARYSAIAVLGILDSLLGATRADFQKKYDATIFVSGLIFNMALAIVITYLGDKLNLDLYLAVIIAFTLRIFSNLAAIRYVFLTRFIGEKRAHEELHKG